MKHVTITNESRYPTDEVLPLIRVAWQSAKPEFKRTIGAHNPIKLTLKQCRRRLWHCRIGYDSARMAFAAPGTKADYETAVGTTPVKGMNEVIVGVAAWCLVAAGGNSLVAQSVTRDAVAYYRGHKNDIDAQIAAAVQRRQSKVEGEFARQVFTEFEQSTFDYKMAKLVASEKAWERKLKLATTKLKTLRRRKTALRAAQTRKGRSNEALPASAVPTNEDTD